MAASFRRIGILTSGGDAPGMNAAIRAITRAAIDKGVEVLGIYKGYRGMIDNEMKLLTARDVSGIITRGGTVLFSDRCDEFKTEAGMQKAMDNLKKNKVDGIIAIGGDGTFRGATDLSDRGIPSVGIPGTIDNDIASTDYTVGFDTALNTILAMVDRLRDTCESHARCSVVEVMGNHAGGLALQSAIACGASVVSVGEFEFDEEACMKKIAEEKANGKREFIVIVSEGNGDFAEQLAKRIRERVGVEARFARLAHVQRGGSPTLRDRLLASEFGTAAVDHLLAGESNIVMCYKNGKIVATDIDYAQTLDRMYKHKLTPEQLAAIPADRRAEMEKYCAERLAGLRELYDLTFRLAK